MKPLEGAHPFHVTSWLACYCAIFFPFVLIAILYIIIYLKLKSHKIPVENSANAEQQQHLQRKRNVLKMAIAIALGFAVCSMPNVMSVLIRFFASDIMTRSCGFRFFSSISLFMLRVNCAINPCICFNFSRNYRKEIKTFLNWFFNSAGCKCTSGYSVYDLTYSVESVSRPEICKERYFLWSHLKLLESMHTSLRF